MRPNFSMLSWTAEQDVPIELTHFISSRTGRKEIILTRQQDASWRASCWCSVFKQTVCFPLTGEQVNELLSGEARNIGEVLLETPPPLREIFITGTTPAEWDVNLLGRARPKRAYAKLGYTFDSLEVVEDGEEDAFVDDPSRWDAEY